MTESRGRRLAGAAWLVGAGAGAKALFLVAAMILYKGLPLADSGAFGLAYTFATTFVILGELGLRGFAIRELAKVSSRGEEAQLLLGDILSLRIFLSVAAIAFALLVVWATGYNEQTILLTAALLAFAILDSLALFLKSIFRVYGRMDIDALTSVGSRVLTVLLLAVQFKPSKMTLPPVVAAYLAGAVLECLVLCILFSRATPLRLLPRISTAALKSVLVRSLPFAVLAAVGILYLKTGTFALSKLEPLRALAAGLGLTGAAAPSEPGAESSLVAVAWFYAATRIPEAITFLPLAVVNAYIPHLTRNAQDLPLVQQNFTSLLRYLTLAGITIAAPMIAEPELVLRILAKPEFFPAATAVQLLSASIPLTFALYVMANCLICLGAEGVVMRRYISALVINILLNLALVPVWGTTGAALALLLSESASIVLDATVLYGKRLHVPLALLGQIGGGVLVAWLSTAAAAPLPPLARALLVGLAGSLYAGAVLWYQDREIVQGIFRKVGLRRFS